MADPGVDATLAHALRAPLGAMRAWIEVARVADEPLRSTAVDVIAACAARHGAAIERFLAQWTGERAAQEEASAGAVELDGVRVLLVDDDATMREALATLLEAYGAEVAAAASGDEAMARARTAEPHVVLCDLSLDREDGAEVLARLRAAGVTAPAAAFTGVSAGDPRAARAAEAFDRVLRKPCDPVVLASVIGALAGSR